MNRLELVLLCGLLCDRRVWDPVAQRLADVVQASIFDFRSCTDIGAMADAVLAAAPPRFALAGHSMGGRVALEVYRKAPDRVRRLALLNSGVHPLKDSEVAGRRRLLEVAALDGMAAVAENWLPPMVGTRGQADAVLMEDLREMVCGYSRAEYAGQIHALLHRPDAEAALSGVRVPCLFVCSEEDRWSPVDQHAAMHDALPGSRLVVIPDAGHMSTVEAPDAVAAALEDWLTAGE